MLESIARRIERKLVVIRGGGDLLPLEAVDDGLEELAEKLAEPEPPSSMKALPA